MLNELDQFLAFVALMVFREFPCASLSESGYHESGTPDRGWELCFSNSTSPATVDASSSCNCHPNVRQSRIVTLPSIDSIKLQSNPKNAHRISDWIFLWQVYLFKNQEKQLVDFLCINFGFRWENADSMPDG